MAKNKEYLLFIDTNIYLDFYRTREHIALKFLRHLENIKDKLISTYQVEMEYKKHRQETIMSALEEIKPSFGGISSPPFLSERQDVKSINSDVKEINSRVNRIKKHVNKVLIDPIHYDEVYRICQRIFKIKSDINLTRDKKIRFAIRRLAQKRFCLGYPPRKDRDTSIGDAINWEWIVECCKCTKKSAIIVSRDVDYGPTLSGKAYINDWLKQEFKDRVGRKDVILTRSLSEALNKMKIEVTPAEKEEDERVQREEASEMTMDTNELIRILRNKAVHQKSNKIMDILLSQKLQKNGEE